MVAHEKRNPAQLFCAVPTQNDLALSSLLFPAQPTQKLGYPGNWRSKFGVFAASASILRVLAQAQLFLPDVIRNRDTL